MKISTIPTVLSAALASAHPHFGVASLDNWKPAGHGDRMSFSYLYMHGRSNGKQCAVHALC